MPHPHQHRCDERTINYEHASEGRIFCRVCERRWKLTNKGWRPEPISRYAPRRSRG